MGSLCPYSNRVCVCKFLFLFSMCIHTF
uniref:Uncharacterized protein n=1 Tax=Rhizophora mucronata TaxID=61149 RepID=A0A2P2MW17_RHIMU